MTITIGHVIDETIRLIEANPEYRYPYDMGGCHYVLTEQGVPPCLFGQAFMNLGVEEVWLRDFEDNHDDMSIRFVIEELGIEADEEVIEEFGEAQSHQDAGEAWGGAPLDHMREAKTLHESVRD